MKSPFRNKEAKQVPLQDLRPVPPEPEPDHEPMKYAALTPERMGDSFAAMQKRLEANIAEIDTEIESHSMEIEQLKKKKADRNLCLEAIRAGQKILAPPVAEVKKEAAQ